MQQTPVIAGIVGLVVSLSGHDKAAGTDPSGAFGYYTTVLVVASVSAVLGFRSARRAPLGLSMVELGVRRAALGWQRIVAAGLMYFFILEACTVVVPLLLSSIGVHGTSASAGEDLQPGALAVELYHGAIAGLVEEPILLALALALATRARWPWWVTALVLIGMRISFHLYYGWVALFVIPWIAAAILLWRWCPLLWPFVIAHSALDTVGLGRAYSSGLLHVLCSVIEAGLTVIGAAVLVGAWLRSRRRYGSAVAEAP